MLCRLLVKTQLAIIIHLFSDLKKKRKKYLNMLPKKYLIFYSLQLMIFHLTVWSSCSSTAELCFIEEENECPGKFGHQCLADLCSETKNACEKYLGIMLFAKATYRFSMLFPYQVKKMNEINKNIKNCTISNKKTEIKEINVCIKDTEKCRQTNDKKNNFITKRICRCHGNYSVDCEQKFCAISSKHCDDFIERVKANFKIKPLRPFSIKTCSLKKGL
jgi:hypothetical protein